MPLRLQEAALTTGPDAPAASCCGSCRGQDWVPQAQHSLPTSSLLGWRGSPGTRGLQEPSELAVGGGFATPEHLPGGAPGSEGKGSVLAKGRGAEPSAMMTMSHGPPEAAFWAHRKGGGSLQISARLPGRRSGAKHNPQSLCGGAGGREGDAAEQSRPCVCVCVCKGGETPPARRPPHA